MLFRIKNLARRQIAFWHAVTMGASEVRAKNTIAEFMRKVLPSLKIKSGIENYKKAIVSISLHRIQIIRNRAYKYNFYSNLFDRELKFLREFFEKSKIKNAKVYLKALKKVDDAFLQKCIKQYLEYFNTKYMIQTRQDQIKKLNLRIKFN
jgi:hypothetical protein